jgi:hypothetical protein
MGKHRSTAEILLSRPVARPQVKHQDGHFPPLQQDISSMPLAVFDCFSGHPSRGESSEHPLPRLQSPALVNEQQNGVVIKRK